MNWHEIVTSDDVADAIFKRGYKEGKQAKIREVVEFAKNYIPKHSSLCYGVIGPHPDCVQCKWQAKLEEWGLQDIKEETDA